MGEANLSEIFRVLKQNEKCEFDESRVRRLVLQAWEKLVDGDLR